MNRNNLVTHLRNAKKAAQILTGRNTSETETYAKVSALVDIALDDLGERTDSHISANVTSAKASVGQPRFGSTPPDLRKSRSVALKLEEAKKDVEVADPVVVPTSETEQTEPETGHGEPDLTDDQIETALEGAETIGQVTEVNASAEMLEEIAATSVQELAKKYGSKEVITSLIESLGGEPKEGGTKQQQAGVLKKTAKAKISK